MQCFNDELGVVENLALEGSVLSQNNTNLNYLQKLLLKWHYRLGNLGFQHVQYLARNGWLGSKGEKFGRTSVKCPKWSSCQFGKQERNPKAGHPQKRTKPGVLKQDKLSPGDLVFSDQYVSRVPGKVFGGRGASISRYKYQGGTLFCDAASNRISVVHQVGFTADETVELVINLVFLVSHRQQNNIQWTKQL